MSQVWKMPIYNGKLLHIHIPKTGGTTITECLKDKKVQVGYYDKASKEEYGNVPPQHMTMKYTSKFFDLDKIKSFAVIRDPWHRTVSEYVWAKRTNRWEGLNIWLEYVLTNMDHTKHNNHFVQQYRFVNQKVRLFNYNDWDKICDYISRNLKFPFHTKGRKQQRFEYVPPSIDILDPQVKMLWENVYERDVELFNTL